MITIGLCTYVLAATWTAGERLHWSGAATSGHVSSLRVATDAHGRAVAIWKEPNIVAGLAPAAYAVRASRFDPAAGWEAALSFEGIESNDASRAEIEVSLADSGDVLALWMSVDTQGPGIWSARLPPRSSWTRPERLDSTGGWGPGLAAGRGGDGLAVWIEGGKGTSGGRIWSRAYRPGRGWETATSLDTIGARVSAPRLVRTENGDGLVAWTDTAPDSWPPEIWSVPFTRDTGLRPARVETDQSGTPYSTWEGVAPPDVAMAPDGDAVAVWIERHAAETAQVWAAHYSGGRWRGEGPVAGGFIAPYANHGGAGYGAVRVAMDGTGGAIAVWTAARRNANAPSWRSTWASRFAEGRWSEAVRLDSDADENASFAQLAMAPDGRAVALWLESTESEYIGRTGNYGWHTVWTNVYVPGRGWDGPQKLQGGGGRAQNPAVAIDPQGRAIVAWAEWSSDGTRVWAARSR